MIGWADREFLPPQQVAISTRCEPARIFGYRERKCLPQCAISTGKSFLDSSLIFIGERGGDRRPGGEEQEKEPSSAQSEERPKHQPHANHAKKMNATVMKSRTARIAPRQVKGKRKGSWEDSASTGRAAPPRRHFGVRSGAVAEVSGLLARETRATEPSWDSGRRPPPRAMLSTPRPETLTQIFAFLAVFLPPLPCPVPPPPSLVRRSPQRSSPRDQKVHGDGLQDEPDGEIAGGPRRQRCRRLEQPLDPSSRGGLRFPIPQEFVEQRRRWGCRSRRHCCSLVDRLSGKLGLLPGTHAHPPSPEPAPNLSFNSLTERTETRSRT